MLGLMQRINAEISEPNVTTSNPDINFESTTESLLDTNQVIVISTCSGLCLSIICVWFAMACMKKHSVINWVISVFAFLSVVANGCVIYLYSTDDYEIEKLAMILVFSCSFGLFMLLAVLSVFCQK